MQAQSRVQREGWSPERVAGELYARRVALLWQFARRGVGRGVPAGLREEIVCDAITAVALSPRAIRGEQHLLGAFWTAVEFRVRRYHEGRYAVKVGSARRVALGEALADERNRAAAPGVTERVEHADQARHAADWLAELTPTERQVITVMATEGIGAVPAARVLGLGLGEVRSAARSARLKLDRVAVIATAGRMCGYRAQAISALAQGHPTVEQVRAARAHLKACTACRRVHRRLLEGISAQGHQQAAAAALAPAPAVVHHGWLGRALAWVHSRPRLPRGTGERLGELIAGGSLVKAAAAGSAVIAATASITTAGHHTHHHHPTSHHRATHIARHAAARRTPPPRATPPAPPVIAARNVPSVLVERHAPVARVGPRGAEAEFDIAAARPHPPVQGSSASGEPHPARDGVRGAEAEFGGARR